MAMLDTSEVAKLLHEFGQRTAFRGGNPYRARAYTRAAENLLAVPEPLERLVAENRLTEIPSVGNAIAITKLHRTGGHPVLEAMRKEVPAEVLKLLTIPGLRPEKALKLHRELGISFVAELEQSVKEDRIRPVKGLGASLQKRFCRALRSSGRAKVEGTSIAPRRCSHRRRRS
jgi:DNA polymerase (family 10)